MLLGSLDAQVSWANKPYAEIRETARQDGSVAVVPVGSVEQHGHHLPVATDSILAATFATEGATRAVDQVPVLVTPPVWTGYSPHHLSFGGTVTIKHDTLLTLLKDVADAILSNDFDALLLLNGHGGNDSLIKTATSTIGVAHSNTEILGVTYFDLAESLADELRDTDAGGMAHGGEFETSLMLHLYPDLVAEDRSGSIPEEPYDETSIDLFGTGPVSVYRPFEAYSESGAIGAPEHANAEKGARLADHIADELADLLREIQQNTATE